MSAHTVIRLLALAALATSLAAAIRWSARHSLPITWDEANYIDQAIVDHRLFASGGVVRLVKALLFEDPIRPPAYRALIAPVTMFVAPTLPLLRALAFFVSCAAIALLFRASRVVASATAALLAVGVVFAMPGVVLSTAMYGTEFPLFLAVALLLWSLLRENLAGVVVAVAIGCLAKVTFLLLGGPAILAALAIDRRPRLLVAAALGAFLSLPWWIYHAKVALEFVHYATHGGRWEVPFDPLVRARELVLNGTGAGGLLAFAALAAGARSKSLEPHQRRAVILGLAGSIPVLALAAVAPVFVARQICPAFLPLVLVAAVGGLRWRGVAIASAALVLAQAIALLLLPARLLPEWEQVDWSIVRAAVAKPKPTIGFLGLFQGISPTEIRYAWLRAGDDATVSWLWNADEAAIDWERVLAAARASDAVLVVAPREVATMHGFARRDNQHNAELVSRLTATDSFAPPRELVVGRRADHHVLLFVRRPGG